MTGPKHEKNTLKHSGKKLTSKIFMEVLREDKARWVRKANNSKLKLVEWITNILNSNS